MTARNRITVGVLTALSAVVSMALVGWGIYFVFTDTSIVAGLIPLAYGTATGALLFAAWRTGLPGYSRVSLLLATALAATYIWGSMDSGMISDIEWASIILVVLPLLFLNWLAVRSAIICRRASLRSGEQGGGDSFPVSLDSKSKRSAYAIIGLITALIVSNVIWAANYFGQSLGCGYQQSALRAHKELLKQMRAVLPVVARGNATRQEVAAATHRNGPREITYETADAVVIGDVALRFDTVGRLVEVLVAPPVDSAPVAAAPATAASPQSMSYAIYSLSPLFSERELIAEGTRVYTPADVQVKPEHAPIVKSWAKTLALSHGFSIGASVYQEPKTKGFGLWIDKNGEGFSWEWFELEERDIFRKLQGAGRVKVRLKSVGKEEEVAAIEFLDDVTFRLKLDTWWQKIPYLDKETHNLVVKKGSVLWLAP